MGIVTVERSWVSVSGFQVGYHLSLVYRPAWDAPKETWEVVRAGRIIDETSATGHLLDIFVGALQASDDRYTEGEVPWDRGATEVVSGDGSSAESLWASLKDIAEQIQDLEFQYKPWTDPRDDYVIQSEYVLNSNSFVASVLREAGIDIFDFLPQRLDPLSQMPGLGTQIGTEGDDVLTARFTEDSTEPRFVDSLSIADVLVGGDGNDTLIGDGDADVLDGGVGVDKLEGGGGDDLLIGGDGDDEIVAGSLTEVAPGVFVRNDEGNDRVFAGDGDDEIWIGGGSDVVAGGDGDDVFHLEGSPRTTVLWGGAGADEYHFSKGANVLFLDASEVSDELLENFDTEKYIEHLRSTNPGYIEYPVDYVILNVDSQDKIFKEGKEIKNTSVYEEESHFSMDEWAFHYEDSGRWVDEEYKQYDPVYKYKLQGFTKESRFVVDGEPDIWVTLVGDGTYTAKFDDLTLNGFTNGTAGITFTGDGVSYEEYVEKLIQNIDVNGGFATQWTIDHQLKIIYNDYSVYELVGDAFTEITHELSDRLKPDGFDTGVRDTIDLDHFQRDSDDQPPVPPQPVDGGSDSDSMQGTRKADYLRGLGGNDVLYGEGGNDTLDGGNGNDELYGGDGDDQIMGGDGTDIIDGGRGDDVIDGGAGQDEVWYQAALSAFTFSRNPDGSVTVVSNKYRTDILANVETIRLYSSDGTTSQTYNLDDLVPGNSEIVGTSGDDTLNGTAGNDILRGKEGDDLLLGGDGSDSYFYAAGDGDDYIDDESGSTTDIDVLEFTDLDYADVTFSQDSVNTTFVTVTSTGHVITLDEQTYATNEGWGLERIEFADGVSIDLTHSRDEAWTYNGTTGNDSITGAIWGQKDIFIGGKGDDYLNGEAGSDTYVYASGDGSDTIDDEVGFADQWNVDVLLFNDLNASDVSLSRDGADLKILVTATGDVITVDDQFYSTTDHWGIEGIKFADGSTLDRADILAFA